MKKCYLLVLCLSSLYVTGFAQSVTKPFCEAVELLVQDYPNSFKTVKGKELKRYLSNECNITPEGFKDAQIALVTFSATYEKTASSTDEANIFFDIVCKKVRDCLGIEGFTTKVGGQKMCLFKRDKDRATVTVMVEKVSKGVFNVKINIQGIG